MFVKFAIPEEHRGSKKAILEYIFLIAEQAAQAATKYLDDVSCPVKNIMELEFEKCLLPMIAYSKKRYAYQKFVSTDPDSGKLGANGVQDVRRDLCDFSRDVIQETRRAILVDMDVPKAQQIVHDALAKLCQGQFDINRISMSKTLRSEYKGSIPAHAVVAKRRRDRGEDVADGDRVRFVFTIEEGRLASERTDDPVFVAEHGTPLDLVGLVERQCLKPWTELLAPVLPRLKQDVIDPALEILRRQQAPAQRVVDCASKRQRMITSFFKQQPL